MTGGVNQPGHSVDITLAAMKEVQQDTRAELRAEQKTSEKALASHIPHTNPDASKAKKRRKTRKAQKGRVQQSTKMGEKAKRLLPVKQIQDKAQQFQRKNPELKANTLTLLRELIKPGDSKEEILKKLQEFYSDVTLADEALDFLLETTDGELALTVQEAKDEFNQENEREISAGHNVSEQARLASDKGLGTPTSLRDMYREITGNPRDSNTLFNELSKKYAYKDLKKVIDYLLHSLGSDMKAKGPSIPRGQLHRLFTETRSLQAILGIYRFFKGRMGLMKKLFVKSELQMPKNLSFEAMAKQFMSLVSERYPTSDKVLQGASRLGTEDSIPAKIVVFSQFRDAIREVSMPKIYKSLQHRDELYLAIIEALEDLEDDLEEELEEEWEVE